MITETLIREEVWRELPEDNQEAFLFIALAAHKRLTQLGDEPTERGTHDYNAWRRQYIAEVRAVAEELGINGLPALDVALSTDGSMEKFDTQLALVLTRIRAAKRSQFRADSVTLSYQTKDDIRQHLEELRAKINASNLSENIRASLHKKVDDVESELDLKRSSLRPLWILAGAISAVVVPVVGTLADLPGAVETAQKITGLAHNDKAKEEEETHRLSRPLLEDHAPLQITDQSANSTV